MNQQDHERAIEGIRIAGQRPCLLCLAPPACAALYVPVTEKATKAVLTPAGKKRLIAYSLCAACVNEPDVAKRVEAKIEAEMRAKTWAMN